jgi:NitT/TauT family transport system permease protein
MRKETLLILALLIIIWALVTSFQLVNPLFLPSPWKVSITLFQLFSTGQIAADIIRTLYRMIIGFGLGAIIGISIGLLMGSSEKVYYSLEFLVDFSRSIPVTALFPLFLVVFGIGDVAKFSIVAWSSCLIILINTMYGVKNSKKTRVMVAQTMGANNYQIFTKVIIFEAVPHIVAGLRTALSLALIVVIVTEMFMGTELGIGQRIFNASITYRIPEMYSAIIIAGLLGFLLNKFFVFVETKLVHWGGK